MRITGDDRGSRLVITIDFEDQEEKERFHNDFFEMLKNTAERDDCKLLNAGLEEINSLEEGIVSKEHIKEVLGIGRIINDNPISSKDLDDIVSKFTK